MKLNLFKNRRERKKKNRIYVHEPRPILKGFCLECAMKSSSHHVLYNRSVKVSDKPCSVCNSSEGFVMLIDPRFQVSEFCMSKLSLISNPFSALALSMLISSCSIMPTAKLPDGSIVTLGASIGTKSKYLKASARYNELQLDYEHLDKDETSVPRAHILAPVVSGAISNAASTIKSSLR
jgi:hypothetical protein